MSQHETSSGGTADGHERVAIPWLPLVLGILVWIGALLFALMTYTKLPDPMPTHFDVVGEPDKWEPKTLPRHLFTSLLGPTSLLLVLIILVPVFRGSAEWDTPTGVAASTDPNHRARRSVLLGAQLRVTAWFLFALQVAVVLLVIGPVNGAVSRFGVPLFLVFTLAAVFALVFGLSKAQAKAEQRYPRDSSIESGRVRYGVFWYEPGGPSWKTDVSGSSYLPNIATRGGQIGAALALGLPLLLILGLAVWSLFRAIAG